MILSSLDEASTRLEKQRSRGVDLSCGPFLVISIPAICIIVPIFPSYGRTFLFFFFRGEVLKNLKHIVDSGLFLIDSGTKRATYFR